MISNQRYKRRWNIKTIVAGGLAILAVLILLAIIIGLPGYVGYREIEGLRQKQEAYSGYDPTVKGVHLRGSAPTFSEAEHDKPRENSATCQSPYSREDADLCAQWAAVKAVSTGNSIAITGLRSTLLGTLITAVSILLTAVGLVIAALASRDAARGVRGMENLERGYITLDATGVSEGKIRLSLRNIGRTPIWIDSVIEEVRGVLHHKERNGLRCVPADKVYEIDAKPTAGGNPGIIKIAVGFADVLNQPRTVHAVLKITDDVWCLFKLHEYKSE